MLYFLFNECILLFYGYNFETVLLLPKFNYFFFFSFFLLLSCFFASSSPIT